MATIPITSASIPRDIELLRGIDEEKRPAVLNCCSAQLGSFSDGQSMPFPQMNKPLDMRTIVGGKALLVRYGLDGNRTILDMLGPGDAVTYGLPTSAVRQPDTELIARRSCMVLDFRVPDPKRRREGCAKHIERIRKNVDSMLRASNERISRRVRVLSGRSLRERVTLYLQEERRLADADTFTIPFDRQELADLLCADRSSLSRELGQMRREGLISFEKNRFTLSGI